MAHSTIADLTVDELRTLIREVVVETLSEMLEDPDGGLELNDDLRVEFERSLAALRAEQKTIPVHAIAE